MVGQDVDRAAIIQEMDDSRQAFHRLLNSADIVSGLRRRSRRDEVDERELLFHMLFGYMIVREGASSMTTSDQDIREHVRDRYAAAAASVVSSGSPSVSPGV